MDKKQALRSLLNIRLLMFSLAIILISSCKNKDEDNEKTKSLIVNLTTPSEFLNEEVKGYLILSGEDGKTLAYTQIVNGQSVKLEPTEAYTGTTFMLTEFYIYQNEVKKIDATTLTAVPVQTLAWSPLFFYADFSSAGKFTFLNNAIGQNYMASTKDDYASVYQFNPDDINIEIRNGASKLYVTSKGNGGDNYHLFDNGGGGYAAKNEIHYSIDLNLVTSALIEKNINLPADLSAYVTVEGIFKKGDAIEKYVLDTQYPSLENDINLKLPDGVFDEYLYTTSFSGEGNIIEYRNTTLTNPDFIPADFSFTINASTSNSVTLTTTGDFDFGSFGFMNSDDENYWSILTPSASVEKTFTLPETPPEIKAEMGTVDLNTLSFSETVNLGDLKNATSYAEFISLLPALDDEDLYAALEIRNVYFQNNSSSRKISGTRRGISPFDR